MEHFRIGDMSFLWNNDGLSLQPDPYTEGFRAPLENADPDAERYTTAFFPLDRLRSASPLQQNALYELYDTAWGRFLIYHWGTCRFAYGYRPEDLKTGDTLPVWFHPYMKDGFPLRRDWFFSTAGMHSKFLRHGAAVLHAAWVDWNGMAILFAAPSQTGKSTQAELWRRYAGAEVINGDRVLLRKENGIWCAWGYPCCGSSKICINRTRPVRAVVLLEQGAENRVSPVPSAEKIRTLMAGTEVYVWDNEEIETALRLVKDLTEAVPVVRLTCRPDAGAVTVLKHELEEMQ